MSEKALGEMFARWGVEAAQQGLRADRAEAEAKERAADTAVWIQTAKALQDENESLKADRVQLVEALKQIGRLAGEPMPHLELPAHGWVVDRLEAIRNGARTVLEQVLLDPHP